MHSYIAVPEGLFDRQVGGERLYSHVVIAQPGDLIFVSGQVPRDENGAVVGAGDMAAQIRQVMSNVEKALTAAGATLADLVRTTTYVTDIDEYFRHVDARMEFLRGGLPTSTALEISRLSHPDFMVEVEAMAIKQ